MEFGLDDKVMRLIRGAIGAFEIPKAVMFGSRAKGNFKYNSDIDICIWKNDETASDLHSTLSALPTPYKFDVVDFDSIKNEDLKEHILRVGKVI